MRKLFLLAVVFAPACSSGTEDEGSGDDQQNDADGDADADEPSPSGGTGNGDGDGDTATGSGGTSGALFSFPGGRRAAVSLTYDDGLDSQLKYALPALAERGLRATFFLASFEGVDHFWSLPNQTDPLNARHEAWTTVGQTHELGGHTVNHPCESNGNPNYRPSAYDSEKMALELDDSLARLARLGATNPASFAYPCHGDVLGISGGESYMPLVNERFLYARTSAVGVNLEEGFEPHHIKQKFGDTSMTSGAELIAYVDEAITSGGWAVFTFHGIGPEVPSCPDLATLDLDSCALSYLSTETDSHEALLDYLVQKSDVVLTAPFGEVAAHLSEK